MTTRQAPSPQQLNTESGASVYSPTILKLYDFGVLGLSNRFVWQCPTKTVLLPFYKEHLGLKHLDVGVGTGFYIARAGLTRSHQVSLLDLNENSLQAAAAQVKQAKVRTFMRDVMQPSSEPAAMAPPFWGMMPPIMQSGECCLGYITTREFSITWPTHSTTCKGC